MSDLRTRIAESIRTDKTVVVSHQTSLRFADAVIDELGLHEQTVEPVVAYAEGQYHPNSTLRRYVTRWWSAHG
jgi:hypothetical protein